MTSITPSQRPTREWPLLLFAGAVVAALIIPFWQWAHGPAPDPATGLAGFHAIATRLLEPEQIACYVCFLWGALIIGSRFRELRRQRRAFRLDLLPTEEGVCILPEDSRPLQRKVDQVSSQHGPFILSNMIRLALGKFAVTRSSHDVVETIRTQAEVDLGRLVASMSTVHYLAWAIPALGFLGTVRGLSGSLGMATRIEEESFINMVAGHLTVAFDCTLVALALSLVLMFLLHSIQRDEEALVIDCRQYCQEHLVNRLYDLKPVPETV